ncbi:MAG: ATP-dependent DNA ligase [Candidatus Lokiarchaeia archaeon]
MRFSIIADFYEKIEETSKRLEMTDLLVQLFKQTPDEIIDKVVYLTAGRLYPLFVPIELGLAEKLAVRSVAMASGSKINEVDDKLKKTGDLGIVTEQILKSKKQKSLLQKPLEVLDVYETLDKIAKAAGSGSVEAKLRMLSRLLLDGMPKEAKYIIRIVVGALRLGIAEYTILDALAIAYTGEKENRPILERAFNISSDLGHVAKTIATKGLKEVKDFKVTLGSPVRMMLAQRLSTPEEILEKMQGECSVEYKLDGERVQAHKNDGEVNLFSRRLENITEQYPDIADLIKNNVKSEKVILEGEIVAFDPQTGELLPFQTLMRRRRKYGINEAVKEYPASLNLFDLLLVDKTDYTTKTYPERRKKLEEITKKNDRIKPVEAKVVNNPKNIELFFEKAVEDGCEGLVAKSTQSDSIYEAGSRGFKWIKYKREYKTEMIDTIDTVIVGALMGRGRRAGTYGAILVAVYDQDQDMFRTISKVGTGFSDQDLAEIPEKLKEYKIDHKHPRVDSKLKADVWFTPGQVIEIIGSEYTLSQVHTAAMGAIKKESGIAVRFPRFTGKWREDKGPEEATTVEEIIEMYRKQAKTQSKQRKGKRK